MREYLLKRVLYSFFAVFGVLTVVFFMLRLSGDPAALMASESATTEDVATLRHSLGLDQPIPVQYARFLGRALRGDLGRSLGHNRPALGLVLERVPATAELALGSMCLAVAVAIPLGILCAVRRRAWYSYAAMGFALLGQSVPTFWLGLVLILVFAVGLNLLPTSGRGTLLHLVLPCVSLAMYSIATIVRLTASVMLDVLNEDFIRTARSKGLGQAVVLFKHALKNAAIPVVTIIGLQMGTLLSGAVITEMIFAWPGVGRLVVQAIYRRDFPLVQAAVIVIAIVFVVTNLLVDVAYVYLNPQIKYR